MSKDVLYQVVVCAILTNSDKELLIARRRPEKKLGGFWEFPGGKVLADEDPEAALKREISEELNLEIRIKKLLHIKNYTYPHGPVLILFYLCDSFSGELQLSDHDKIEWRTVAGLKELKLLPANEEALAKLQNELT